MPADDEDDSSGSGLISSLKLTVRLAAAEGAAVGGLGATGPPPDGAETLPAELPLSEDVFMPSLARAVVAVEEEGQSVDDVEGGEVCGCCGCCCG